MSLGRVAAGAGQRGGERGGDARLQQFRVRLEKKGERVQKYLEAEGALVVGPPPPQPWRKHLSEETDRAVRTGSPRQRGCGGDQSAGVCESPER